MPNEKILIVKFESTLPAHEAKLWEANGWEVKYEMCPAVREFIDAPAVKHEYPGDTDSYPMPSLASWKKVDEVMSGTVPVFLDFTDNISHADMDRFLSEISEIENGKA